MKKPVKVKESVVTTVVYINDVNKLIETIIKRNNMINPLVKIGIDGGQGSFKVFMSIIDQEKAEESSNSVHDAFINFIGFNIQENQSYLVTIWLLLNLDGVNFILCIDLKTANLLCEIKAHGCRYPCCFCLARLEETGKRFESTCKLRTVGNITECYKSKQIIEVSGK